MRGGRRVSLFFLSLAFSEVSAGAVFHPTFVVNSTADVVDANPGDGICDTIAGPQPHDAVCTLRAAVMEANKAVDATILVPSGTYILSIPPGSCTNDGDACGDLNLTASMNITRTGSSPAVIDATGLGDRIFDVNAAVALTGLTLQNGQSLYGGCLSVYFQGDLTITDSVLSGCSASADGGGITDYGPLTIVRSTITGNHAALSGGGIFNDASPYICVVIDSTIVGNTAGRDGGGIYNVAPGGTTRLYSATVAYNSADADLDGIGQGGGISNDVGGTTFSIVDSVIAGNFESTLFCAAGSCVHIPYDGDCAGTITSQGYNMLLYFDPGRCTVTGLFTLGDPKLDDTLRDNGGPTQTLALLPGSPAIDAGNPSGCTDPVGATLTTDQRGVHRALGTGCDIGAFESGSPDGDANGDGHVDVADVFYLINFLFAGGPLPPGRTNVNGDGVVDVADVFYLVNYLFAGGPAPVP